MAEEDIISSKIDQLLGADFEQLTTEQILQTITGGQVNIPYDDLQSEEGFEKELQQTQKKVDELVKSLEPQPPPIPMEKIEELACNFEGDALYAQILLESIRTTNPSLFSELRDSNALQDRTLTPSDLGVSSSIPSLNNDSKLSSAGIVDFLNDKDPSFLEKTNERIFDNLDPLLVGKPSNSGSRKKRDLSILGFNMPLEFIMSGKTIAHVKISGPKITNQEALDKINETLSLQYQNSKPCDFKDLDLVSQDDEENANGVGNISSRRVDEYDSNFFPEGDDPVLDQDCAPGLPEDPITGDVIATKSNFDDIQDEFCDPPAYDFSGLNPDEPEPEAPEIDVDAIDACIGSALDKANKIDEKNKLLGRWSMIERNLEEVLYHYEIIWEFQKNFTLAWANKVPFSSSGDPTPPQAVIQALTLNDQAKELDSQIAQTVGQFKADKKLFLDNNRTFTQNLFNLTVIDLEQIESFTEQEAYQYIREINASGNSFLRFDEEIGDWRVAEGYTALIDNLPEIREILIKGNFIDVLRLQKQELIAQRDQNLNYLGELRGRTITINNLQQSLESGLVFDLYNYEFERVFQNVAVPSGYDSYGWKFIDTLKDFSARFTGTNLEVNFSQLNFKVTFMNNLGQPLPYKTVKKPGKISLKSAGDGGLKDVLEPDVEKIKLGNEFASNGGLLSNYPKSILNSSRFLSITNLNDTQNDVANFYDFVEKVIDTNQSKSQIINDIVDNRGVLYGQLIEKSGSNWLFFSPEERGDNDARNPSKLRPSSFTPEGEPNPVFTEFYGNFKPKWDAKYQFNKTLYVDPAIETLKAEARRAAEGAAQTAFVSDFIAARVFSNYFDMKDKMEQIEQIILFVAQKRQEMEDSLQPSAVEKEFSDIKCSADTGAPTEENDPENCPPPCCGPAGSDFKSGGNFLLSSPPSSDCPTIFQRCWWKQFCKDVTKVGLLPYPNGLPPIEKTSYFLSPGPTVRLGLKYWPVGYLPPAFIPIPVPNPIDGLPYIRIPLPMIWTIIPPIVIPLPFNLGILVIFIPLIGGFMPTPLVYLKEFITGSSLFLTGIRGPRFIPRKSDPTLKDPLEKIKQALSFGIPDKLIPLPGFGKDNIDAIPRILTDIQSNFTKILDNIPEPGDIDILREVQGQELVIKEQILSQQKEFDKVAALLDEPLPNFDSQKTALNQLLVERKSALKQVIRDYLNKGIPNPKTIYFPKEKDSLKIDIPGIIKALRILKELKASLVPITCGADINFKDEIREVLKLIKIPTSPIYILDNFGVSNPNKIFYRNTKDPRLMTDDEFSDLVKEIKATSLIITHILLKGNKFSVIKKVRKGAFSIIDGCELQGDFAFPPVKLTNAAPSPLKFLKVPNPILTAMYLRIMEGMSRVTYTPEDFARYVRYDGENPLLVIRVKDLKKLISKKLGLSRRGPFDPERPLDREEPQISKFPHPEGPLCCLESLNGSFGKAIAAFELPTVFPPKSDQITQSQGAGGIIQITIPGAVIKSFAVDLITRNLDRFIDDIFPEIGDINSPKFINLQPGDIQKMSRTMLRGVFDPESPDLPDFLKAAQIPIIPARPTDLVEQALIGLGAPPPARIVYSLFWKYYKGLPKTPLLEKIARPPIDLAAKILPKIPWPLTVLLGRNLINLINPIAMSDDHPAWRRMSLKNTYYVIYIDEFLRSAADVSGLFKFFLGSADPVYPVPELPTELQKAFNIKKY